MKSINRVRLLVTFIFCLTVVLGREITAKITVHGDALDVLDASRVVIVKLEGPDQFRIEEILLDEDQSKAKVGDTLALPNFKLSVQQMYGPDLIHPITDQTRILLYLQRKPTDKNTWIIAQRGFARFWVQDPAQVEKLRNVAQQALEIRRQWNAALNTPDVKQRIKALWPFLENHNHRFHWRAQKELQKIGTAAGDYLAERLEAMSPNFRMRFLTDLHLYKSKRLHRFLLQHLKKQQELYENLLKNQNPKDKILIDNWDKLPENRREIYGELYYGLAGLADFRDRKDLPYIRQLALWAVRHRFKQTCDAALGAFRDMPARENLPIIAAIWHEFSVRQYKGNEMTPSDVMEALYTHKFADTVPLLAQFLNDTSKDAAREARYFLTKIVGRDLGPNSSSWLQWYQTQKAKPTTAIRQNAKVRR